MSGGRVLADPALPLPPVPAGAPALLDRIPPGLALAAPAASAPLRLRGRTIAVDGGEREARWLIRAASGACLYVRGLEGAVANVLVEPRRVRREVLGKDGAWMESALAAAMLPLAVVQWRVRGAAADADVSLGFVLDPGAAEIRYRVEGCTVGAAGPAGTDLSVAAVHPPPATWSVRAASPSGVAVEATVRPDPRGSVTVAFAAGPPPRVRTALAALAHLERHAAAAGGGPSTRFALRTGVPALDEGVAWLVHRLDEGLPHAGGDGEGAVWPALGALATGLDPGPGDPGPSAPDRATAAVRVLLTAQRALTRGETAGAARVARSLLQSGDGEVLRALGPRLLGRLADAVHGVVAAGDVARLRRAALLPGPGGARTLPMAGSAPATAALPMPVAAALPLLAGAEEAGVDWTAWRRALEAGLAPDGSGRGRWSAAGTAAVEEGRLAAHLVHGLVGWSPDAPAGRAHLAPRLPSHLTRFEVPGLRVGDAEVDLRMDRYRTGVRYRLEPLGGSLPCVVVLHARPGPRTSGHRILVDGAPADIDGAGDPDDPVFSCQLSLDAPRVVEIPGASGEVGEEAGPQSSSST